MPRIQSVFQILILFGCAFPAISLGQDVHHWEAVIEDGSIWRYWVPNAEPPEAWKNPGFYDAAWPIGPSGFGYSDGDDATTVPATPSLYLRRTFDVNNLSLIHI